LNAAQEWALRIGGVLLGFIATRYGSEYESPFWQFAVPIAIGTSLAVYGLRSRSLPPGDDRRRAGSPNLADLEMLSTLRDRGALSEDEFARAKSGVINRILSDGP
jgi:hypothetical protein